MIWIVGKTWAAVGVAMAAVALALFLARPKTQLPKAPPLAAPPPVATGEPPVELTLPGSIQAIHVVNVSSPVEGVLRQFVVETGEEVAPGQVLAKITNAKLENAVQAAEDESTRARNRIGQLESALIAARLEVSRSESDAARARLELERAEKTYQRQQLLWREGITARLTYEKSEQEYNACKRDVEAASGAAKDAADHVQGLTGQIDAARSDVEPKTKALEEAKAALEAEEVRSPVAGAVVGRSGQPGDPVDPTVGSLLQIATDVNHLQILVSPQAAVAKRVHPGQAVTVLITGDPPVSGTVRAIKDGQVVVEFESPSPTVRAGMAAQVKLVL